MSTCIDSPWRLVWIASLALLAAAASASGVAARDPGDASTAGTAAPVEIPAAVAGRLGVTTAKASLRPVARDLQIVGTVLFDQDRVAIVGPKLAGRVLSLAVKEGERVRAGTTLAEIESVELARAAADYLGSEARATAAETNAEREIELARRKVSSTREREVAVAEAQALRAQAQAAEQLLLALGLSRDELPARGGSRPLSRYALRAPLDGVVVERNALPGEAIGAGHSLFKIADLGHVWVALDVFERDLAWVRPGLVVELETQAYPDLRPRAAVRHVDEDLGRARVAVDLGRDVADGSAQAKVFVDVENPDGRLVPGQFVTATLRSSADAARPTAATVVVPRPALQSLEGASVVFVRRPDGGFVVRHVRTGSTGTDEVEIVDGLAEGEEVAITNAFLLKSEVLR